MKKLFSFVRDLLPYIVIAIVIISLIINMITNNLTGQLMDLNWFTLFIVLLVWSELSEIRRRQEQNRKFMFDMARYLIRARKNKED
ncbi:hypothetical protein [Salimicrobium album]|uniref:Uncharacterized protein n=1 Tax=Salimicrobium album TaxID=50717 RepID=A0A1H3DDA6_9BACI|nr:hypothetical protein [Salimicrobium album]SDX64366.1 hypothetical protein SAMN04488081_0921 [Salimicrobium album]